MFKISHFYDAFFASSVQNPAEEEQRERAELIEIVIC